VESSPQNFPLSRFLDSNQLTIDERKAFSLEYLKTDQRYTDKYGKPAEMMYKLVWTANPWQMFAVELEDEKSSYEETSKVLQRILPTIDIYSPIAFNCVDNCIFGYRSNLATSQYWQYHFSWISTLGAFTIAEIVQNGNGTAQIAIARAKAEEKQFAKSEFEQQIQKSKWLLEEYPFQGCTQSPCSKQHKNASTTTSVEYRQAGPWLFAIIFTIANDANDRSQATEEYIKFMDSLEFDPDIEHLLDIPSADRGKEWSSY